MNDDLPDSMPRTRASAGTSARPLRQRGSDGDRVPNARAQLIQMLAERLVRDAIAKVHERDLLDRTD